MVRRRRVTGANIFMHDLLHNVKWLDWWSLSYNVLYFINITTLHQLVQLYWRYLVLCYLLWFWQLTFLRNKLARLQIWLHVITKQLWWVLTMLVFSFSYSSVRFFSFFSRTSSLTLLPMTLSWSSITMVLSLSKAVLLTSLLLVEAVTWNNSTDNFWICSLHFIRVFDCMFWNICYWLKFEGNAPSLSDWCWNTASHDSQGCC